MFEPKTAAIRYENQTWALSFACAVNSIRMDISVDEAYLGKVENLPIRVVFDEEKGCADFKIVYDGEIGILITKE